MIAAERYRDALACAVFEDRGWFSLKGQYDDAKEDDELREAERLKVLMLEAGWQAPRMVKSWDEPPAATHRTVQQMVADVTDAADGVAARLFQQHVEETAATAASGDLQRACRQQHEALYQPLAPVIDAPALLIEHDSGRYSLNTCCGHRYWCGFFTSAQGSSSSGRNAIAEQWHTALTACEAEVAGALGFANAVAALGSAELRTALATPQVQLYMRVGPCHFSLG